jgi:Rieske Fe-S protein
MEHDETNGSDDVSRRGFIATAIAVTAACGCCGGEASAQEGPGRRPGGPGGGPGGPGGGGSPADRAGPEDAKAPKQVDAGPLSTIKQDGVDVKFAKTGRFLIIRQDDKVYASSSICTHKSCFVKLNKDKQIACPCHGSKFSNEGIPESGAKATDPLFRFGVSVNDKGHVIVDKTKKFEKAQWSDEGAWVKAAPTGATSKPA